MVSELRYPTAMAPCYTCVCCHTQEGGAHWDARDGHWKREDGVCGSCFDNFIDAVEFPRGLTVVDAATGRVWRLTRRLFDGVTWLHNWVQGRQMTFLTRSVRLQVAVALDDAAQGRRELLRAYAESLHQAVWNGAPMESVVAVDDKFIVIGDTGEPGVG